MRHSLLLTAMVGVLSLSCGAGSTLAEPRLDAAAVAERLSGRFMADPAGGAEAPSGRLHALMQPVSVPALGGRTIYLQWRDGGPDGKVTRQRLWTFVDRPDQGPVMKFYGFKDGAAWVDAHLAPDRLAALTMDQLVAYPDLCDLPWRMIEGSLQAAIPDGCRIVTQRTQRTMDLSATVGLSSEGFRYREAGRLEDGSVVFQVPPAGDYVFRRE